MTHLEIKIFKCNICQKDNKLCEHVAGNQYDDIICKLIPVGFEFLEITLDEPTPPKLTITDMVLVEDNEHEKRFTWYGFKSEKERNHRIQGPNIISNSASEHFIRYFSSASRGVTYFDDPK